jgi:rubredoxin
MFTICPECGNDKLKTNVKEHPEYDATTGVMSIHGEETEYHCRMCGWVAVVEQDTAAQELRG